MVAQCTKIAPASAPRKSGVTLVHEKAFRDLGSGFVGDFMLGFTS